MQMQLNHVILQTIGLKKWNQGEQNVTLTTRFTIKVIFQMPLNHNILPTFGRNET